MVTNGIEFWEESLKIFKKTFPDDTRYIFAAEHDCIYGPDLDDLDTETRNALINLGWHIDDDVECIALFT